MIELKDNSLDVSAYLSLRSAVSWKVLSMEQAKRALENSLLVVGAYEDGQLVGMGRLVGDGAVICYIQDLIVVPEAQKKGVGSMIIERLIAYVKMIKEDNTEMMLALMCAKGRESFYIKHDFLSRPTEALGPGMIQYINE